MATTDEVRQDSSLVPVCAYVIGCVCVCMFMWVCDCGVCVCVCVLM